MAWLYFAAAVLGYLLGSFPTGYLVGRHHGIDIREHGSRNMGATNVVRVLGKKPGYLVFFCDALKGLLAVRLMVLWVYLLDRHATGALRRDDEFITGVLQRGGLANPLAQETARMVAQTHAHYAEVAMLAGIVAGLCCILGHNFPVWLRFRGGKGVATTIGVILGLMPAAFAVAAVVWAIAFFTARYVSLASMLAAAALPVTVGWLTRANHPLSGSAAPLFWFSVVAALLIFWRHRANIGRLLNGTESRFDRKPAAARPVPPPPAA